MRYHKPNSAAIQRNPRSLSRTQTGFSLLELLISMAITVIAVIAAVGLMTKFARTVGAFTEVSTMGLCLKNGIMERLMRHPAFLPQKCFRMYTEAAGVG